MRCINCNDLVDFFPMQKIETEKLVQPSLVMHTDWASGKIAQETHPSGMVADCQAMEVSGGFFPSWESALFL